ncbi:MAG: hypothetical protein ACKV2U_27555 [Bryobacteraceae bacterium]
MTKRINIVLPETTIRNIDRLVKAGERSRFINCAVEHYVATQSAEAVRKLLELTAVRDRDLDKQIAEDWSAVDQQSWRQLDLQENIQEKQAIPKGARSTSRRLTRR